MRCQYLQKYLPRPVEEGPTLPHLGIPGPGEGHELGEIATGTEPRPRREGLRS